MRLWHWLRPRPFRSWQQQIAHLKTETPLLLPPVKPLVAQKAGKPFIGEAPVTPWPENVTKFETRKRA